MSRQAGFIWGVILLTGGMASCASLLGDDFEVVNGADGGGGNGTGASTSNGAGGTGGSTDGGGGSGGGNCPAGFADCDADPSTCETDVREDADNCGACNYACGTANTDSVSCVMGACVPVCTTGFDDCTQPAAPDPDDGCERQLGVATDCAACGHDCLGGDCVSFDCQPVVLASNAGGNGRHLTIDANNVYWTDRLAERVSQVPKAGGSPLVLHQNLRFGVVTVDATTVYWGGNPGDETLIGVVPIGGGTASNYAAPSTQVLGVNATYLYYSRNNELWRIPKGGPFNTGVMVTGGAANMAGLFVDGTNIYFTSNALIRHYDEATNNTTLLYNGSTSLSYMAGDATNLYLTNGTNGEVIRAPRAGGSYTTLATGGNMTHVAVNATHVFATDETSNRVIRVPKVGGPVDIMSNSVNRPYGIAADGVAVYFTSTLDGNVYKKALPPAN